ncbi:hypothetical protein Hypma_011821 [Hypsizygus marmoreus]|uniref:Arrestin-like N-terminal domain-containing protein n=1 Tax=Hypsizygus marmoreus TaxID=39966 RepID=A0A369JIF3_HYPMA|nr:hypothetical protein Hypma_011821 [Hypsizygus marmoreus]
MSIAIEIVPGSNALCMFGEADSSSAYSLSGHVSISVASHFSLFERRRTARILLRSLTLTFEGQTEVLTPQTGYSSLRLCSITREIAPCEPVELSNEGHEDSDEPCIWNVIYDIPIPGWLPETTTHGVEDVGVRYSLFAEAKFTHIDDNQSTGWSFSTLCSPFRSRMRTICAQKQIPLKRFICPIEDEDASSSPTLTYLVNSPVCGNSDSDKPRIPAEVLSSIQVLASIPDYVDVGSNNFPLTIRMRTQDLESAECQRIQVESISANLVQHEKCRTRPAADYLRRYPIPSTSQQPPNIPLREAHPVSSVYDVGLCVFTGTEDSAARSFSLLPPGESGIHPLGKQNYPFVHDADSSMPATWYTLESTVPFVHQAPDDKTVDWAGSAALRPTMSSPLISVRQEVAIEVMCTYDVPGSDEVAKELLSFSVPIRFARFAPDVHIRCFTPPPAHSIELSSPSNVPGAPVLPSSTPYANSLPAYSQLFDRNGDRKIDYSVPLPLYSPRSSADSPSSSLDLGEQCKANEIEPLLTTPLVS